MRNQRSTESDSLREEHRQTDILPLYSRTVNGHGRENIVRHLPPVLFFWCSKGMGRIKQKSSERRKTIDWTCPQKRRDSKDAGQHGAPKSGVLHCRLPSSVSAVLLCKRGGTRHQPPPVYSRATRDEKKRNPDCQHVRRIKDSSVNQLKTLRKEKTPMKIKTT